MIILFCLSCDPQVIHLLTHSFPTRHSSDLPFDVLPPDVEAVKNHQVLAPAGHHETAVDHIAEIAGIEPAVGGGHRRGGGGIVEVAVHDAGSAHDDAADMMVGQGRVQLTAHLDLVFEIGRAHV